MGTTATTKVRAQVRLIGLPTDSRSSFMRGAAAAPPAIRAALASDHSNMASESGLEIGGDIALHDFGDLELEESPGDVERIRDAAAATAVRRRSSWAEIISSPTPPSLASLRCTGH